MKKEIRNAGALVLATLLADRVIAPSVNSLVQRLLEPPVKITASVNPVSEQNEETNQNHAIIMNGLEGNSILFSTGRDQKAGFRAACEAYNFLAKRIGKENITLFLSNPYNVPGPENAQRLYPPVTTTDFLGSLENQILKPGRIHGFLLDPSSNEVTGLSGMRYKGYPGIELDDNSLFPQDIRNACLSKDTSSIALYEKIILFLFSEDSSLLEGFKIIKDINVGHRDYTGPRDSLILQLKLYDSQGNITLPKMLDNYRRYPTDSLRELTAPYLIGGLSFNHSKAERNISEDPDFNKPFLYSKPLLAKK